MRDARTGTKTNIKLRADETVEQLRADEKEMQYLFHDGDAYTFMDQESFERGWENWCNRVGRPYFPQSMDMGEGFSKSDPSG